MKLDCLVSADNKIIYDIDCARLLGWEDDGKYKKGWRLDNFDKALDRFTKMNNEK